MIANANITRNTGPGNTRLVRVLRYRADPAKFKTLADLLTSFVYALGSEGRLVDADKIQITVGRRKTPAKLNGRARGSRARVAADKTAVRGGEEEPRGAGSTPAAGTSDSSEKGARP